VKEQLLRTREVDIKQNSYWAGNIAARDQGRRRHRRPRRSL
jgi:hypothetical protein